MIVAATVALLFIAWGLLGWLAMPRLIESTYRQESYPLLNKAISGRNVHSVDKYLADWNQLFAEGSVVLLAMATVIVGLTRQRIRSAISRLCACCRPADAKQLTQWLAIGIALLVVVQCCIAIAWGDLLSDGASYLSVARLSARRDVP